MDAVMRTMPASMNIHRRRVTRLVRGLVEIMMPGYSRVLTREAAMALGLGISWGWGGGVGWVGWVDLHDAEAEEGDED